MNDEAIPAPRDPVLLLRGTPRPITAALAVRYPAQHPDLPAVQRGPRADRGERGIVTSIWLDDAPDAGHAAVGELRREVREIQGLARELPQLRHIIVLLDDPASSLPRPISAWHAVAERLHARLEQECGSYVTVTVLLTAGCTAPGIVARRIWERVATESPDPAVALSWQECVERPITVTAANLYV